MKTSLVPTPGLSDFMLQNLKIANLRRENCPADVVDTDFRLEYQLQSEGLPPTNDDISRVICAYFAKENILFELSRHLEGAFEKDGEDFYIGITNATKVSSILVTVSMY